MTQLSSEQRWDVVKKDDVAVGVINLFTGEFRSFEQTAPANKEHPVGSNALVNLAGVLATEEASNG